MLWAIASFCGERTCDTDEPTPHLMFEVSSGPDLFPRPVVCHFASASVSGPGVTVSRERGGHDAVKDFMQLFQLSSSFASRH